MDDRDVALIEEYIQQCTVDVEDDYGSYYFDLHSYSRWAANEVLQRVICEAMKLPPHISGKESLTLLDVVETFIDEMDYYAYLIQSERAKEIFSIARDEGKCILFYICSSQRKENNK